MKLPDGVSCSKTYFPGSAELSDAVSRAKAGECVVAAPGTYRTAVAVPAGVMLLAEPGKTARLEGATAASPAVSLAMGAMLSGVTVAMAPGIGVLVDRRAALYDVIVDHAASAGIVAWCEEDCSTDPEGSVLQNVEVTQSAVGLWVRRAKLKTVGGRIAGSQGQSLGSGYGVVASHGANLELKDTVIETNQELGALVDGALDTTVSMTDVRVRDNLGRGIWAQGLTGSDVTPRLTLERCTLESNAVAGLGARGSTGIRIQGGRIASTRLAPAQSTTPGVIVMVGDGVGLFESTGAVRLDAVALDSNQRAQVLIDKGAAGLVVQGGTINMQSGQQGVVVQRTTETVQAAGAVMPMPGMELPISSPLLATPTR